MHLFAFIVPMFAAAGALAAPPRAVAYRSRDVVLPPLRRFAANDTGLASLFICEHVYWTGDCELKYVAMGSSSTDCQALDGKASAIGPDPGFTCTFYKSDNCRDVPDGFLTLTWPGVPNLLLSPKGNWNDAIKSFFCVKQERVKY